ncbi:hypothetical protein TEA_013781 [Camellia sinensis var. sinensis]|uniref:Protein kinase domain-containing protein n=1 Tax=Camellia sinensis var. sinensis TaxID=542762 RepID=A0A4S4E274_CAMSN|nr:hypothetical protein TEA_013781 [Camellia sinensis var. sinensis]
MAATAGIPGIYTSAQKPSSHTSDQTYDHSSSSPARPTPPLSASWLLPNPNHKIVDDSTDLKSSEYLFADIDPYLDLDIMASSASSAAAIHLSRRWSCSGADQEHSTTAFIGGRSTSATSSSATSKAASSPPRATHAPPASPASASYLRPRRHPPSQRPRRRHARQRSRRGHHCVIDLSYNNFIMQVVPCKDTLQIKVATNNFDDNNKIGEGGFGSVYKGILLDGTIIAVKQLSSKSTQGNREFVNEIGMISGLQHPNLVRLYGCCIEGNQLLLVYEYMENNSLARALFELTSVDAVAHAVMFNPQHSPLLALKTRLQSKGMAIEFGLAYQAKDLYWHSKRDIKATNVLLDGDLNPKISDFGLAKLTEDDNTHISTRVAGTIGYMAPEYALWGYLSNKADVYSFGIVALEIAAGKDNMKFRTSDKYVCLLDWALVLQQKGRLMELVDPKLGPDFDKEEAIKMIKIALLCTNPSPAHRPAMSAIVSMLEGHLDIQDLVMDPSIYGDEYRFRSLKDKYDELQLQSSNEAQSLIDSTVTTQIGSSSASTNDLYQINLDSA